MENALKFDLDDTSPTVKYSPLGDTLSTPNLLVGWNPYYDQSGFATTPGVIGNGTSLHITSLNGASLSVQWRGTGIQLLGNATLASYLITIDGQNATPRPDVSQNILTSIDGLEDTSHTVTLIAQTQPESTDTSSMLVFDKAVLISSPTPPSSNVSFQPQRVDETEMSFLGNWLRQTPFPGNTFHISNEIGARVITTFKGSSLLIQGKTSPTAADYQVTLDNSTSTSLSGRSSFTSFNTTLYFATGLDPSVTHSIEIRNADGGELALLVGGFNTFTPIISTPSPSDLPDSNSGTTTMTFTKGTLAAFILGGILAFILLSMVLFYFLIYRPRRQRNYANNSHSIFRYSPKGRDPVMNIAQKGSDEFDFHPEDARSGRSAFSRWRREPTEGSVRGTNFPLEVRHSGTMDEKKTNDDGYVTYDWSADVISSPFSDDSSAKRKARAKSKGKARQITGRSWSPSFKLDLPVRRSHQQLKPSELPASYQMSPTRPISQGYMSSFQAAEPSPNEIAAAAPPSYAASTSLHTSNSFVSSLPSSLMQAASPFSPFDQATHHQTTSSSNPAHTNPHDSLPLFSHHRETDESRSYPPTSHQRDESLLDPSSLREVLRSLSPRTSVRPASGNHADNSRSPFVVDLGVDAASQTFVRSMIPDVQSLADDNQKRSSGQPTKARDSQASKPLTQTTVSDDDPGAQAVIVDDGLFLSVTETSPFRVDFDLRSLSSHPSRKKKGHATESQPSKGNDKDAKKHSRISSALSHVRFESFSGHTKSSASSRRMSLPTRSPEFVQGTSKAPFRLTPLTLASSKVEHKASTKSMSDGITSFLDFTSSSEGSILSRSRSVKTTASEDFGKWEEPVPPLPSKDPKSRWSSTTMPTSDETGSPFAKNSSVEPKSRWSNTTMPSLKTNAPGLQASSSSGSGKSPSSGEVEMGAETEGGLSTDSSTFPIPFKIAIPPSSHHILQPESSSEGQSRSKKSSRSRSQRSRADSARALTVASGKTGNSQLSGLYVHPEMGGLDSPTESMGPMSVSELHFSHSLESEGLASKRTTSSSMPLFTNGEELPPLPEEYRPRPFDPSILVNRVLGLPSPGVSSTTMSTVRGQGSNYTGDASSALASSSFVTRTPSPRYDMNFSS
ncbi:hypothetical protein CVT24_006020 [Panaeolus cyanescens]|uniref:Uncharacterized protein n=1 Tax=Panaeolus cyanescens TaxID=181874 RepID=A0A409YE12_9AGAR|nr:hypothetical protein CVT24_006020 [Panaeolus cyanescens]